MFKGEWENNKEKTGKGFILWKGKRFTGDIKDGKPEGKGSLNYKNGNFYEGNLVKGKRNGYGVLS